MYPLSWIPRREGTYQSRVTVFLHIYDERGHHVHGPERKYERHDVVLHRPQTLIPSSRGTTSSALNGNSDDTPAMKNQN